MNGYIIHLPKSNKSLESAQKAIDSVKRIKNLNIFLSDGVDRYNCWSEWVDSNFNIHDVKRFNGGYIDAELATFFSHYKLWKKCKEMGQSIIIFEHDVILEGKIDIDKLIKFNGDVLNLGEPNWGSVTMNTHPSPWIDKPSGIRLRPVCKNEHNLYQMWTTQEGMCHCDTQLLYGAHAYLITPHGADKLIKGTSKGIVPADVYIRQELVDIYDYLPHPFKQDDKFSLIQRHQTYTNQEIGTWDY